MNNMSASEVKERVAQLARVKRLRLSEEIKNKRVAKIKSKLYHKIKRKNKEKEEKLLMEQLEQIDPETAKKVRMRQEEQRVDERMRMRHSMKNKYARNLLRFAGDKDEAAKQGIKDMIRIRDENKRKRLVPEEDDKDAEKEDQISEEEEKEEDVDSESEKDEKGEEQKQKQAEVEAQSKEIKIDFSEASKGRKAGDKKAEKDTGLFALKFMKDADVREEEQLKQQATVMSEMMQGEGEEEPEESEDEKKEKEKEENEPAEKGRQKKESSKPVAPQYSLKKLSQKMYQFPSHLR